MKRAKELLKHDPDAQVRLKNYFSMPATSKLTDFTEYDEGSRSLHDGGQNQTNDSLIIRSKMTRIEKKLDHLEFLLKNLPNTSAQPFMKNAVETTNACFSDGTNEKPAKKIKICKANLPQPGLPMKAPEVILTPPNLNALEISQLISRIDEDKDSEISPCSDCSSVSTPSSSNTIDMQKQDVYPVSRVCSQIVSIVDADVGESLLWDE
jgi:hypothetical protein